MQLAIEQLSCNGKNILWITHLLEEAGQLCNRVAFIVNGHIVANDTLQNLKLFHGKQSLKVFLSDPIHADHLEHGGAKRPAIPVRFNNAGECALSSLTGNHVGRSVYRDSWNSTSITV
jgi:ABC-type multidrug transport system ATPase subunit